MDKEILIAVAIGIGLAAVADSRVFVPMLVGQYELQKQVFSL